MLQTSTDSINQFLQSKSSRNNFSYSIKYISPSNLKVPYFNKSILNKNRNIISPKIDLIDKNILKTYINKNHISNNYLKSIRYFNKINSSEKIINKSSDNFPRIIQTKRGKKEITGNTGWIRLHSASRHYTRRGNRYGHSHPHLRLHRY